MRTVTVRDVQHHLAQILKWVEDGEEVEVTRRKRVIAKIVPSVPRTTAAWPDVMARLHAHFPSGPITPSSSELLIAERDESDERLLR